MLNFYRSTGFGIDPKNPRRKQSGQSKPAGWQGRRIEPLVEHGVAIKKESLSKKDRLH